MSTRKYPILHSRAFRVCLGLAILALSVFAWQAYRKWHSIQSQMNTLRAEGLPLLVSELDDYYEVPDGVADSTQAWMDALDVVRITESDETAKDLPWVGYNLDPIPPPDERWDRFGPVRAFLTKNQKIVDSIRYAASQGGQVRFASYRFNGTGYLPIVRLMMLAAYFHLHDGDTVKAKQDILAIVALSEAIRGEISLVSQNTRTSIRNTALYVLTEDLIPHGEWADGELLEIQRTLRKLDDRPALVQSLNAERVLCLGNTKLPATVQYSSTLKILAMFDKLIVALNKSWFDANTMVAQLRTEATALEQGVIERYRYPGVIDATNRLTHAIGRGAQANAILSSADAIIAIKRFQMKHNRLPMSLDKLVPEFLPAVPVDPFDGKPMRYRITDSSVVVYSIADNKVDDNGARWPLDMSIQSPLVR